MISHKKNEIDWRQLLLCNMCSREFNCVGGGCHSECVLLVKPVFKLVCDSSHVLFSNMSERVMLIGPFFSFHENLLYKVGSSSQTYHQEQLKMDRV